MRLMRGCVLLAMFAANACTGLRDANERGGRDASASTDGDASGGGKRDAAHAAGKDGAPNNDADANHPSHDADAQSGVDSGHSGMDAGPENGGDAAPDADARVGNADPQVTIEFPLSGRTDADSITVRGIASDPDGDPITSVTVNGTAATVEADGNYSVVAPLAQGDNLLEVQAQDALGASSAVASVTVRRAALRLWGHPSDLAFDGSRERAIFVDQSYDAVFSVELASGESTAIADAMLDFGPVVTSPSRVEVDVDNGRAYVLASGSLFEINLVTLERTAIPLNLGSLSISDIAFNRGKLYAAGGSAFFEIQLPSGEPRTISDDANTTLGPALQAASVLAIDLLGETAYIAHESDGSIKSVDMSSGMRALFTGGGAGSGPNITGPLSMLEDRDGYRLLVTDEDLHGLYAVSRTDGTRSILVDANTGTGVRLDRSPTGLALDPPRHRVLIADWMQGAFIRPSRGNLVWVDLATGHRTLMSKGVGSGQGLTGPGDIVVDTAGNRALLADPGASALIAVHLGTGNRLVLSDEIAGQGPALQGPLGLGADFPNHRVFVADSSRRAILSVDLTTGNRTLISEDGKGGGPSFEQPLAVIYDEANARLLVVDGGTDYKIMSVDLGSGNRLVVSDGSRTGPALANARAIAFGTSADTLLAAVGGDLLSIDLVSGNRSYFQQSDPNQERGKLGFTLEGDHWFAWSTSVDGSELDLLRIDLASGERTVLSGIGRGKGPLLLRLPTAWQTAAFGRVVLVSQQEASLVLAVDTVSGDRIVFSM